MDKRILGAAVFAAGSMLFIAACNNTRNASVPVPPAPAQAKVDVRIPPPQQTLPPRINSFTAEPRSIARGQSAILRWTVENATEILIDARVGAVGASGSQTVSPKGTSTYTLIAKSATGTDLRSVTVEVITSLPHPPEQPPSEATISGADLLGREGQDVYFDYDKTEIRDDGRLVLTHDADVLKRILASNPNFTVALEGHCDERGSAEYNLGLGDQRASAAKDFLLQLGVPDDRVKTISYGKERPFCTDANEACYQRNRRAHLAPAQ